MLMENKFGKISRITACAGVKKRKDDSRGPLLYGAVQDYAPFEKRRRNPDHASLCLRGYYGRGFHKNFLTMIKEGGGSRGPVAVV
mgnify:CR=1 FL=1